MAGFTRSISRSASTNDCQYARIELRALAQQWDRHIRHDLGKLAERRWPDRRLLGLIPVHSYRLRRQQSSEAITWWIEHDLPPQDLYRCAAYRVTFCLDQNCHPTMILECQSRRYPIEPLTPKKFRETLLKLETQPPLTIPRKMGVVTDP